MGPLHFLGKCPLSLQVWGQLGIGIQPVPIKVVVLPHYISAHLSIHLFRTHILPNAWASWTANGYPETLHNFEIAGPPLPKYFSVKQRSFPLQTIAFTLKPHNLASKMLICALVICLTQ